jgi:glyoxylase-like metal-dependent hydrolase (beta-lactamase superfamily II)
MLSAPEAERAWLSDPSPFWRDDDTYRWNVYRSFRPQPLLPGEPVPVNEGLADGARIAFGPARIDAIATPGHTGGSLSYAVDVDGRRVVFCGDLKADGPRLWDVYSLQRGFEQNGRRIGAYHGFMGDQWRLKDSLRRVAALKPDNVVSSHGASIDADPAADIGELIGRIDACYENYVSISALRHYFPELFTQFEGRPGQMPLRPHIDPPECVRKHGTTWMLVSETGAALPMDCGSPRVVDWLKTQLADGAIDRIDALWVTHYHADHTAGIPAFQQQFDVPCICDRRLADVLTQPEAWRLPCLDPRPMTIHRQTEDGESWPWHEFKLTAWFFPGQTFYHDALLVERGELRMLFVGDSFTPAGIDDYCAYNRNLLGEGIGSDYCLKLIDRLRPTHIFNCHVPVAWDFPPEVIARMRRTLAEREQMFTDLVAWDHANFGTDGHWARAMPYQQTVSPGGTAEFELVVTNHSPAARDVSARAVPPTSLAGGSGPWIHAAADARGDAAIGLAVPIPADTKPGRYVVPIDIALGPIDSGSHRTARRELPRLAEAIVDVRG